jgi:sensor histidine kinase YesM
MWRIYVCASLAYTGLVGVVTQLDELMRGRFDGSLLLMASVTTLPAALLLALAWPLTGYLVRRKHRPWAVFTIHVGAALTFGAFSLCLLLAVMQMHVEPLNWHVWPFLYNLLMYSAVAGVFHLVRANQAAHRQAIAMREAQNLLIASELSALRSKLNPHFLFNTLHSIIALTRKDPGAAETALFQFSDMLRYVLDAEKSGNDRVTLEDELRFVRDYLELEALRLGERLTVQWNIDDEASHHSLPALTLQPLVENSIKHAFNPHSRPGRLQIGARLDAPAKCLRLAVSDDGPGADLARVQQSNGLGIRTVERRLLLDYGSSAQFNIYTNPGAGFAVSLSIPLEEVEPG